MRRKEWCIGWIPSSGVSVQYGQCTIVFYPSPRVTQACKTRPWLCALEKKRRRFLLPRDVTKRAKFHSRCLSRLCARSARTAFSAISARRSVRHVSPAISATFARILRVTSTLTTSPIAWPAFGRARSRLVWPTVGRRNCRRRRASWQCFLPNKKEWFSPRLASMSHQWGKHRER